jgi:hypothetical protein
MTLTIFAIFSFRIFPGKTSGDSANKKANTAKNDSSPSTRPSIQYSLISRINISIIMVATAGDKQCEVVLVGCGLPGRGMGWYHAEQLLKGQCPSAKLCYIIEPWFLGAGTSPVVYV